MPLARYHKLDPAKRDTIIDAAAEEFAANGFDGASINKIIAAAGISKGAVYYYFEDKTDLFITVLEEFDRRVGLDRGLTLDADDADGFWTIIHDLLERGWHAVRAHPQWIALGRAFRQIPRERWFEGRIGGWLQGHMDKITAMVRHGQALGAMRDDLPVEVLVQLAWTVNDAFELWMFAVWDDLDEAERHRMFRIGLENFHRMFLPFPREMFAAWHPLEEEEES